MRVSQRTQVYRVRTTALGQFRHALRTDEHGRSAKSANVRSPKARSGRTITWHRTLALFPLRYSASQRPRPAGARGAQAAEADAAAAPTDAGSGASVSL